MSLHDELKSNYDSELNQLEGSSEFKACVCYFSLFLKDKCIFLFFRTKYIEKKCNLQLFFLPIVSQTFILSRATTCYRPH